MSVFGSHLAFLTSLMPLPVLNEPAGSCTGRRRPAPCRTSPWCPCSSRTRAVARHGQRVGQVGPRLLEVEDDGLVVRRVQHVLRQVLALVRAVRQQLAVVCRRRPASCWTYVGPLGDEVGERAARRCGGCPCEVIGLPSSNLMPSLSVYVQVLPPSDVWPVSVARSPTTVYLPLVVQLVVGQPAEAAGSRVPSSLDVDLRRVQVRVGVTLVDRDGAARAWRRERPRPGPLEAAASPR